MLRRVVLDPGVHGPNRVNPLPAPDARLDRNEDDRGVGQRGMDFLVERGELVRDLVVGRVGRHVVVAGIEHDDPRLVRNHDPIGVLHRVGDERAAESAVDHLRPELWKRLGQIPAHDAGRADEDDRVGRRRVEPILLFEPGDRRFPAIGRRRAPLAGTCCAVRRCEPIKREAAIAASAATRRTRRVVLEVMERVLRFWESNVAGDHTGPTIIASDGIG